MEKQNPVTVDEKFENIQQLSTEDVYKAVGTSKTGLTKEQVSKSQENYGKNIIAEKAKVPKWKTFVGNFTHMMAMLLWIAGFIAFFAEIPELGISIWLVNLINGIFSYVQESRAGEATDALKNMLPSYTRVLRDGKEEKVLAEDLVVGDIMLFEEGDSISADGRLVDTSDLEVNQSVLTGESNPVSRNHAAVLEEGLTRAETPNLVFAGTDVSEGNGKAIVTGIGMDTEFGNIASLTQNMEESESPLTLELNRLTKQISVIALTFGVFFFLGAYLFVGEPLAASFIFALGMIVAFIPEGLLPTVTLSLARAVQRMSAKHALVKKLNSVETLGSTSVICTDKTGTLTQNEMTVNHLWLADREYEVTGVGYAPVGDVKLEGEKVKAAQHPDLDLLLNGAALCSNARLIEPNEENSRYTVLGDPTEACLGVAAQKAGIDVEQLKEKQPRLRELHFESRRKRMSVINHLPDKVDGTDRIAYVKGSPKEVMQLSNHIRLNGEVIDMSDEYRQSIMSANDNYARSGLRVIAVAYRLLHRDDDIPSAMSDYTPETIEKDLVFVGLVVMADPPRPEVAQAVEEAREAGIRIIMITGDYGLTAESIARRIGIVKGDHPRVFSGLELEAIDDNQLKSYLKDEIIFARVAPEQKLRVVKALQEMGEIVAVTGDGVNDSPALKKADIGVAMGITGTDVAKEAADMILTDDNFASIVDAIEEGRAVYSNIRKFLVYIFTSNMAEAVPSMVYLFSRGAVPLPLTVMQILTIDLGTDLLPALGLGTERAEEGIMKQPPRDQKKPLLTKGMIGKAFFWYGLISAAFAMLAYLFVNVQNGWPATALAAEGTTTYIQATTMTLAAIVFAQIGNVYNSRTELQSVFKVGFFSNRDVNKGVIFEILLILAIVYIPFLQGIFQTATLGWQDWIMLAIIPVIIVLIEEGRKYISRQRKGAE